MKDLRHEPKLGSNPLDELVQALKVMSDRTKQVLTDGGESRDLLAKIRVS
jgi:hypothetical protein